MAPTIPNYQEQMLRKFTCTAIMAQCQLNDHPELDSHDPFVDPTSDIMTMMNCLTVFNYADTNSLKALLNYLKKFSVSILAGDGRTLKEVMSQSGSNISNDSWRDLCGILSRAPLPEVAPETSTEPNEEVSNYSPVDVTRDVIVDNVTDDLGPVFWTFVIASGAMLLQQSRNLQGPPPVKALGCILFVGGLVLTTVGNFFSRD